MKLSLLGSLSRTNTLSNSFILIIMAHDNNTLLHHQYLLWKCLNINWNCLFENLFYCYFTALLQIQYILCFINVFNHIEERKIIQFINKLYVMVIKICVLRKHKFFFKEIWLNDTYYGLFEVYLLYSSRKKAVTCGKIKYIEI